MATIELSHLSDDDLISATRTAVTDERNATVYVVALLAEIDARRLYLGQGCSSLFAYCTNILHLPEHAAYHRIEAARVARQFPLIFDRLASGDVTLTAIGLLRSYLTTANHVALLDAARHQSKRNIERLISGLAPRPDVTPLVRRLPVVKPLSIPCINLTLSPEVPRDETTAIALAPPPAAKRDPQPSSDDRYLLRLTIGGATHARLQRARDLLRHSIPTGDPAAIVDRALTVLVDQLERTKFAATERPRPGRTSETHARHVPAAVKREVWARDGGCCTFVGPEGRCAETGCLEFHHLTPYAHGGVTDAGNLTLRCRAHNAFDARLVFGDRQAWLTETQSERLGQS